MKQEWRKTKMKADGVCIKRRDGSLVGTGTLSMGYGILELRTIPQAGTKYKHIAKGVAQTVASAAMVVADNALEDPLGAAGTVAIPVVKSVMGSLTHTNLSRMRVETDFGRSLKKDLESKVDTKEITNYDDITTCIWSCLVSNIAGVQLNNNQLLITDSGSRYILEFSSSNKAKKFFEEIKESQ